MVFEYPKTIEYCIYKGFCMNIKLLAFLAVSASMVVVANNGEEAQQQVGETPELRKARLAFTDPNNIDLMKILPVVLARKEAEDERKKFAAALFAGRTADRLRQAQLSDTEFTRHATVFVNELLDFLAMLDMARTIIQESFEKSSLVNAADYVDAPPLLLALIDLEKAKQVAVLNTTLGNVGEFKKLLAQLSAVNEVLLSNLSPKAKSLVAPYMKALIATEVSFEPTAPEVSINEKTPSI